MNPFPVIRLWLDEFGYNTEFPHPVTRSQIRDWITRPSLNGNTLTIEEVYEVSDVDLMIDCMIAAGIGNHLELGQCDFTVS